MRRGEVLAKRAQTNCQVLIMKKKEKKWWEAAGRDEPGGFS